MRFLVTYWVHIIESQRPKDENFPTVFPVNHVYDVESEEHLAQTVNGNYEALVNAKGITVYRDSTNIMPNGTGNVGNRIFINWNMISYLNATIKKLTEPAQKDQTLLVPSEPDPIPEPTGMVQ